MYNVPTMREEIFGKVIKFFRLQLRLTRLKTILGCVLSSWIIFIILCDLVFNWFFLNICISLKAGISYILIFYGIHTFNCRTTCNTLRNKKKLDSISYWVKFMEPDHWNCFQCNNISSPLLFCHSKMQLVYNLYNNHLNTGWFHLVMRTKYKSFSIGRQWENSPLP